MPKISKPTEQNPLNISIWEQEWSQSDYNAHSDEFKKMRQEYRTSMHTNEEDAVLSEWRWFESQGAIRIDYFDGNTTGRSGKTYRKYQVVVLDREKYRILGAKREKYNKWLCVQEKLEGIVAPSFQKMASEFARETKVLNMTGDEFKNVDFKTHVDVVGDPAPLVEEEKVEEVEMLERTEGEELLPGVNF